MIKIKNYEVIKAFGQRVRDLRISKNLSQEELANLADDHFLKLEELKGVKSTLQ